MQQSTPMRVRIIILGLILMLLWSSFISVDVWSFIKEKTWISTSSRFINGEQIVFYESANGVKRAIRQFYGSGVYVVSTIQYDVNISNDTLYINDLKDKSANIILVFSNHDYLLVSDPDSLKYRIQANIPIIYNWQGDFRNGEILPFDTLKKFPIRIGLSYEEGIFGKSCTFSSH